MAIIVRSSCVFKEESGIKLFSKEDLKVLYLSYVKVKWYSSSTSLVELQSVHSRCSWGYFDNGHILQVVYDCLSEIL